jgi:hypothetical protein
MTPSSVLSINSAIGNPTVEFIPLTDDSNNTTTSLRLWGTKFGTANRYSEIKNITNGATSLNELAFDVNGGEAMRIAYEKSVGIRTAPVIGRSLTIGGNNQLRITDGSLPFDFRVTAAMFQVKNSGGGVLTSLGWSSGNYGIGIGANIASARVQIKGSGSTAATTTLLVQNSAGTQIVKVQDDGKTILEGETHINDTVRIRVTADSANIDRGIKINASVYNDKQFISGYGNSNGGGLRLIGVNTGNAFETAQIFLNPTHNGSISFDTGSSSSVQRMYIDGDGGIGINTSSINSSVLLDMTSTTKGVLFPRMTTTQRNAISSPETLLIIANITTTKLNYYDGSAWVEL